MTDGRPDPERLLAAARSSEPASGLGRLKVFLGYAPGVGKTYTMLEAARAQERAGVDVVVGVVVTHGRAETAAQLEGLPAIPLRVIDHHGARLEEFSIETALKRRPQLLLVDELAHANAPGSRHPKRWQDVIELLDAGIDIYTTLNIQHVESQHDVILRLSGVDVRERVPNEVLDRATEVELVDLPPVDLLDRLRAGKVYLGDAADRALAGFFTEGTLDGLREIALRQVADRVRSERGTSTGDAGKLLVCIGPSPLSEQLLRATRRMADRTQSPWIAVHVQTPESVRWSDADRARAAGHLQLADTLGADVHEVSGDKLAETVIAFARRHGVSRIVVGKPIGSWWRDRLFGSLVADLIHQSGDIDVYVITGEAGPRRAPVVRGTTSGWDWLGMACAGAALGLATGLCWLLAPRLAPVNLCMIYLLAVVLVAFRGRRGPVIAASIVAIALFDFLFIPPFLTFTVNDAQYLLTFAAMLMIGLTVSTLVSRLRRQIDEALRQAATAQALHRASRDLAATRGTDALIEIAQTRCQDALGCRVAILINDAPGAGTMAAAAAESLADDGVALPPAEVAVAQWVLVHGQPAGAGTDTLPGATGVHIPLTGTRGVVGVMSCLAVPSGFFADPSRRRVIEALAKVIGLAIECDRLATMAQDARIAADAERLRNTLLSSVSHDLRTPLAAIAGTASTLLTGTFDLPRQHELLGGIAEEAERMSRLVANLLDIVRLESGAVKLRKVAVAVEDVIGAARAAVGPRLNGRILAVDIPPEMPPIPVDEVLIQSVLVNLLDNAVKYTPASSPIAISASARAHSSEVTITVSDRGPGIAAEENHRIFDKFYRGAASAGQLGAGLGLSICKSIIEAHGGTISVANRVDGGAEFRFTIPLRSGSDA